MIRRSVKIQLVAFLCLACGVILRSVGRARDEARRLVYLGVPHPGAHEDALGSR